MFIHQGMCSGISCMQCYPSNSLVAYQCRYITNVTPIKLSSNSSLCFDTRNQNEDDPNQIKVMVNSVSKGRLFLEKQESKAQVMLTGLGSRKNSKLMVLLYNINTGSRMSDCSITEIRYMFPKTPDCIFDAIGKLKWWKNQGLCGKQKKERQLGNALLADDSSSIKITVWEELVDQVPEDVTIEFTLIKLDFYYGSRLPTLPSTKIDQSDKKVNVDWNIYNFSSETKTWCCPFIDSIKINKYVLKRTVKRR